MLSSTLKQSPTQSDLTARQMEHLAKLVEAVASLIPKTRPIVFLDYPVHLNVGDSLIEAGTERFFEKFGYNVVERRSAYDFGHAAQKRVDPDAILVLQGGGNFGDLYALHQDFRKKIISAFPKNRIVMLPQTMHFDSPAKLAKCAQEFARHQDLHVCLRDEKSLEIFRRHFSNPSYLVPDMAHLLWTPLSMARTEPHGGNTLIFARQDKESQQQLKPNPEIAEGGVDWNDLVGYSDKAAFFMLEKLHRHRGVVGNSLSAYPVWRIFRSNLIAKSVRFLHGYDQIVTNRLHMSLLGLLLGRKVRMTDNTYGKLSNYHSTWLRDVPNAQFLA